MLHRHRYGLRQILQIVLQKSWAGSQSLYAQLTRQISRSTVVRNAVPRIAVIWTKILSVGAASDATEQADRLLQQNRHKAEVFGTAAILSAF